MEVGATWRGYASPSREDERGGAADDRRAGDLDPLMRSLGRVSIEDIDRVIGELQRVRSMLHSDAARLSAEIVRYAGLNHSLMATMKIIREGLRPVGGADMLCMSRRLPPFQHI
jgi:hypothetical protein